MSKEMDYFIFLIERYADYKNTTADVILELFDSLDITNFIFDMYDIYHIERIENAFDDIAAIIKEKQKVMA